MNIQDITNIYVGNAPADAIYIGTAKVWPKSLTLSNFYAYSGKWYPLQVFLNGTAQNIENSVSHTNFTNLNNILFSIIPNDEKNLSPYCPTPFLNYSITPAATSCSFTVTIDNTSKTFTFNDIEQAMQFNIPSTANISDLNNSRPLIDIDSIYIPTLSQNAFAVYDYEQTFKNMDGWDWVLRWDISYGAIMPNFSTAINYSGWTDVDGTQNNFIIPNQDIINNLDANNDIYINIGLFFYYKDAPDYNPSDPKVCVFLSCYKIHFN